MLTTGPTDDSTAAHRGGVPLLRRRLVEDIGRGFDAGAVVLWAEQGYGKTIAIEQAAEHRGAALARVRCAEAEGDASLLFEQVTESAEAALARVDRLAATLVAANAAGARLLLEELGNADRPMVIFFEDAGALRAADPEALRLVEAFLDAGNAQVSVAVAGRRSIGLRTAKLRSAGRLVEFGPAELAFDASECASLCARQGGVEPALEEIEAIMTATGGWPLAVSSLTRAPGPGGDGGADSPARTRSASAVAEGTATRREVLELVSRELAEELLDPLPPARRRALVAAALPRSLDSGAAEALGLDDGLIESFAAGGLFLRRMSDDRLAFVPMVRELLSRRAERELGGEELERLHLALGHALAARAQPEEALEHLLEARAFDEVVRLLAPEAGPPLPLSPEVGRAVLARLPARAAREPAVLLLRGHVVWCDGYHGEAAEILTAAIEGLADRAGGPSVWFARLMLADALSSLGRFDEVIALADGFDGAEAVSAAPLPAAVASIAAIAIAGRGQLSASEALAARIPEAASAASSKALEAIRAGLTDLPSGHLGRALGRFDAAAASLEDPFDPIDSRLQMEVAAALLQVDRGEPRAALARLARVGELAESSAANGYLAKVAHVHRAAVLASLGRVTDAEDALSRAGEAPGMGWRRWAFAVVPALLAGVKGEPGGVLEASDRALALVATGPIVDRWRATSILIPPLVAVGLTTRAREVLEGALADCEDLIPGARGAFLRARLLALRAWVRANEGEDESADADLERAVEEAGGEILSLLRGEWERISSLVWRALEHGRLDAEAVVRALALARPDDRALAELVEHPHPAARRAAVGPALASGHPVAQAALPGLMADPDPRTAAAARAAAERLTAMRPPLVFSLFGEFNVRRGSWLVDETAWERPMTARIVRFLLVHREARLPEDALFEAFWPDKDAAAARRALQVALSRARAVLDPPSAPASVIDGRDRSYRLVLSEQDIVDVDEFEIAAAAGLAAGGPERLRLLERARRIWTGEPLPEDRYAEWSLAWRERLKDRFAETLSHLIQAYRNAGDAHGALDAARCLVDFDPLNEAGHRELMGALAQTGRTAAALHQFLVCRQRLVSELGVEPSPATARLQARILAGS